MAGGMQKTIRRSGRTLCLRAVCEKMNHYGSWGSDPVKACRRTAWKGTKRRGAEKTVFALDVPFGVCSIKELAAPAGYVTSDEVTEVTANYQGQDVKTVGPGI